MGDAADKTAIETRVQAIWSSISLSPDLYFDAEPGDGAKHPRVGCFVRPASDELIGIGQVAVSERRGLIIFNIFTEKTGGARDGLLIADEIKAALKGWIGLSGQLRIMPERAATAAIGPSVASHQTNLTLYYRSTA